MEPEDPELPTPQRAGLSREEAQSLTAKILSLSRADQVRLNIRSGWRGFTRYAENRITSSGGSADVRVSITSVFGRRVASLTTNLVDDDAAVQAAVRHSEELARLAPEDPEHLDELGEQEYVEVEGYADSMGELSSQARVEAAVTAIRAAEEAGTNGVGHAAAGYVAAGYIDAHAGAQTIATSNGLFSHYASTGVASTLTVRGRDGSSSGWAGGEATDFAQIDSSRIAEEAVAKCLSGRHMQVLEPGAYRVILEPAALGMLMLRFMGSLDARTADEGRSFFAAQGGNRIGEALFDRRVTLRSDPRSRGAETSPFDVDGQPRRAETWVQEGVLERLSSSRFWAGRQGVDAIPMPANLIMSGGDSTIEEMISATERGVLITRFWYVRPLNPRTLSYTGLTRDGTFLIENGRIQGPIKNFRFNQSLAELLRNIEMLGEPVRVAAGENSSVGAPIVVPPARVRQFNLASISDAI